jgi:hypothetical protein
MAERIISMRALLRQSLEQLGSKHAWNHITDQVGGSGSQDGAWGGRGGPWGVSPTEAAAPNRPHPLLPPHPPPPTAHPRSACLPIRA